MSHAGRRRSNTELAERLARLADLLELTDANPFRVRAYRNAAESVAEATEQLADLLEAGEKLTTLKGVGPDLARTLEDLALRGATPQLTELELEVPVGLLDVKRVPGVGPKRAALLWRRLGVTGLQDLEEAARARRLSELPGFGAKSEAKILEGVARVRDHRRRVPLVEAEAALAPLVAALGSAASVLELETTGELRRGCAMVDGVGVLAAAEDPGRLLAALREHDAVRSALGSVAADSAAPGSAAASGSLLDGRLRLELRVVEAASFGAALLHHTGSEAHRRALERRARERGLTLSEEGLRELAADGRPGRLVAAEREGEIYGALGVDHVPPELREGRGEIEAAAEGRLPRLLEQQELRGDLHLHTTWSDGSADPDALIRACAQRGYAYMAITDHSQVLRMTGGLDAAKLARQWIALDELQERPAAITLLRGLEVDVLKDGSLDLGEEWLARLDLVIASVHSHFDLAAIDQTKRVVRALEHPQVNVLAHPTGRVLGRRGPYALELSEVFAAAAAHRVALELNAAPYRLDLGDELLMQALEAGCRIAINTDAHTLAALDDMRYGVITARRGWLTREHVVNAWPLEQVRRFLTKQDAAA